MRTRPVLTAALVLGALRTAGCADDDTSEGTRVTEPPATAPLPGY
ncbi:hypothetical protein [Geodermatophilus ruber]|uniref:Uncharacterized protein n=1 Tax=Geodermatophilus ruber TaxID=504800 RepID=A0A1I4KEE9_9ACTN|nr:hypothetical protein [Geodermatophilus ruber]SFL77049.1 hypothetical protein SAMN04488085_11772 [Geodermatophilus ruber]